MLTYLHCEIRKLEVFTSSMFCASPPVIQGLDLIAILHKNQIIKIKNN